ncbi:hypothetical protein OH491_09135 [Termitidicoccus mucosus]|uniref:Import component protein n=1 Tax=Termitidicoccus mucosus TaxID=1184151 RepID=A0A178ID35_9BACT|nr:hypothetical protein AW736_19940 [Opitutaceae bacterium TSB47]
MDASNNIPLSSPPSSPPPPPPAPVEASAEDKTVAIVAYLTLIGFIIAIILHGSKKTRLGAFHLRQVLGIFVTGIVCMIPFMILSAIPVVGLVFALLTPLLGLGLFVLWILGLIAAANGQLKPIPLTNTVVEKFFPKAFD